jgi:hypothetical protein
MSYALDIGLLGSGFCTLDHRMMETLLRILEGELAGSRRWRLSCPLGTEASGTVLLSDPTADAKDTSTGRLGTPEAGSDPTGGGARAGAPSNGKAPHAGQPTNEFSLRLFPVPIFRPILCAAMSGRVVVAHWLMSTANHAYERDTLLLPEPVTAVVEDGRVAAFEGPGSLVRKVREHYRRVAGLFEIEADVVHSWHAGIHPQAFYPLAAVSDVNRWGSVAFANPRYAHFHTCGSYAPGEIAWSIFNATIALDGREYWSGGRFRFLERPDMLRLAEEYEVPPAQMEQRWDIGLSDRETR